MKLNVYVLYKMHGKHDTDGTHCLIDPHTPAWNSHAESNGTNRWEPAKLPTQSHHKRHTNTTVYAHPLVLRNRAVKRNNETKIWKLWISAMKFWCEFKFHHDSIHPKDDLIRDLSIGSSERSLWERTMQPVRWLRDEMPTTKCQPQIWQAAI